MLRDLQKASDEGRLTPSFIDAYARFHHEKPLALYSLASRNFMPIAHEEGRNDHVLTPHEPRSVSHGREMLDAQERAGRETLRRLRRGEDDARPWAMRNPTRFALPVETEERVPLASLERREHLSDYLPAGDPFDAPLPTGAATSTDEDRPVEPVPAPSA